MGANALPLDTIGTVTIPISLGTFTCKQDFIVGTNLIPCILGADFLSAQMAAIMARMEHSH